jgi:hypothetical protein
VRRLLFLIFLMAACAKGSYVSKAPKFGYTPNPAAIGGGAGSGVPTARGAATANLTLSGTQTVDGVALGVGDRELVAGQSTASQNGLYVVASGAWTRTTDALASGTVVSVQQGTANASTAWQLVTQGAITVGTTALTFTQVSPPDFGPNVNVLLPDSNGTNVNALNLTTTLTSNTPGATTAQTVATLMSGGTPTTAMTLGPAQTLFPSGTQALPGVAVGQTNAGFSETGTGTNEVVGTSVNGQSILLVGWNSITSTGNPYTVGVDNLRGMRESGTGVLTLFSNQDIQIGADGANATNATVGFIDLPTSAGTPTGVPADVRTGKVSCEVDTTNLKICCFFSGEWK